GFHPVPRSGHPSGLQKISAFPKTDVDRRISMELTWLEPARSTTCRRCDSSRFFRKRQFAPRSLARICARLTGAVRGDTRPCLNFVVLWLRRDTTRPFRLRLGAETHCACPFVRLVRPRGSLSRTTATERRGFDATGKARKGMSQAHPSRQL